MVFAAVCARPVAYRQIFCLRVSISAIGAELAGRKRRSYDRYLSPVPCGFVLQLPPEFRPTGVGNTFSQAMILLHVLHTQVLQADHLVLANQPGGQLVQEVHPGVSHLLVEPGHLQPGLLPVLPAPKGVGFRV